jgi:calcium-dependent protein kinase
MGCGVGKSSEKPDFNVINVEQKANLSSKIASKQVSSPQVQTADPVATCASDLRFRAGQFIQHHSGSFYKNYRTIKELGQGGFGHVYLAEHRTTKQHRAVKEIEKAKANKIPGGKTKFIREVEILGKLDHPNIVRLYELYEDNFRYYVVSELLTGGELFDYIVSSKHLSEPVAARIMHQVFSAVSFCHQNNIVHRDLKPENLMLETAVTTVENINIKLIDFGTSCFYDAAQPMRQKLGTPYYIAPEVLGSGYNEKCDLWSCGVILYILLSGFPPFPGKTDEEIIRRVRLGKYTFAHTEFDQVSEQAKNFIKRLLVLDPGERPSAQEALQDPWIRMKLEATDTSMEFVSTSLEKLAVFRAETKLKQAVLTFITSQIVNQSNSRDMRETFKRLDSDGNGRLSKEELIAAYAELMSEEEARSTVESVMQKVDADGNGYIDYSEFMMATMNQHILLSKQNMETAFNMFDKDGSGSISVSEIRAILGEESLAVNAVWEQLVKDADTNGDGVIDLREFKHLLLSAFNESMSG